MFRWLEKLFNHNTQVLPNSKSGSTETLDKYIGEEEQLERMREILKDHPDASGVMKMMADDYEKRTEEKDNRGSASSPISSP